jgi:hypothetical protein
MNRDLVENHFCKWCERQLSKSAIARFPPIGGEAMLQPTLCWCGGITIIPITNITNQYEGERNDE